MLITISTYTHKIHAFCCSMFVTSISERLRIPSLQVKKTSMLLNFVAIDLEMYIAQYLSDLFRILPIKILVGSTYVTTTIHFLSTHAQLRDVPTEYVQQKRKKVGFSDYITEPYAKIRK